MIGQCSRIQGRVIDLWMKHTTAPRYVVRVTHRLFYLTTSPAARLAQFHVNLKVKKSKGQWDYSELKHTFFCICPPL